MGVAEGPTAAGGCRWRPEAGSAADLSSWNPRPLGVLAGGAPSPSLLWEEGRLTLASVEESPLDPKPSQSWHSLPTSCPGRGTSLPAWECRRGCGRWVGAERGSHLCPLCPGPGAQRQEAEGPFSSLCLCVSGLLGGVHMAAAPVLDPEAECSKDVILVGSSDLSSSPTPGPQRGEAPLGAGPLM